MTTCLCIYTLHDQRKTVLAELGADSVIIFGVRHKLCIISPTKLFWITSQARISTKQVAQTHSDLSARLTTATNECRMLIGEQLLRATV